MSRKSSESIIAATAISLLKKTNPIGFEVFAKYKYPGYVPFDLRTDDVMAACALYVKAVNARREMRRWATAKREIPPLPRERLEKIRRFAAAVGVAPNDVLALGIEIAREISDIGPDEIDGIEGLEIVRHSVTKEVFGTDWHRAWKLDTLTPGDDPEAELRQFLSIPLIVGGKAVLFSGEYKTVILCRCRLADRNGKNPRWHLSFHPRGWLYHTELKATNQEILEHITEEVDRGETPISGFNNRVEYR
jgi:hypothetical protein